ncbi:PKHD-type hydroxylase [Solimonas aquatica]|uniref:PKHD-type hydroxylase n=1 Tax=Solimonas aquatica TaxID=489703 RepID=A0A1H9CIV0_9GAMM|nr:Fe2+-dependent dioxygenase [Solimonas aquatica]SEQ01099.1 PKHD-type hydroxylase [Solimonas aquatica]
MMVQIPQVLDTQALRRMRETLLAAGWVDGRVTAGHQSAQAKHNLQLREDDPLARELGALIVQALLRQPLFVSAALPDRVYPPLFNRYENGGSFGTHIDNAIREHPPSGLRLRTDLSATLFLNEPEEYEGGELLVEDTYGVQRVKLPAGHLILYPASSLHQVRPVTRGARLASFMWIQSLVRDDAARTLLFDLDRSIQQLRGALPEHAALVQLTGVYHNLLRRWSQV